MRSTRFDQRGLAALAFVLVLLFTMSLAMLWTGRSLVFEHRAAANQQRQAVAFAAAESGISWASARLNDERSIDAQCSAAASGASFRDRYAAPWVTASTMTAALDNPADASSETRAGYAPPPGLRASCRMGTPQLVCDCAASPTGGVTPDDEQGPSFSVELAAVVGETRALWLVARGCSGGRTDCASTAAGHAEAQAVIRVKLRLASHPASSPQAAGMTGEVVALRTSPLAVVPGSWRDGHCSAAGLDTPCGFEP